MRNNQSRHSLKKTRRWVVKIGSALLTDDGAGLDTKAIDHWSKQLASLSSNFTSVLSTEQTSAPPSASKASDNLEIILVSSGAVAEGMQRLGWSSRPKELFELQAAAAVGQMGLIQTWESSFQKFQKHTAQILLTHDDLSNRKRYLNARSTICHLLKLGIIPIVNENDTVVTDEIKFGDNDTLAALVANLVEADALIILTDQEGLFDSDPRMNPQAKLVTNVNVNDPSLDSMAGDSKGSLGRGGMSTKLKAARLAARSGTSTIIASGRQSDCLNKIYKGDDIGSFLLPDTDILVARKQWLAGHLQIKGQLTLDKGATQAIISKGASILAIGVVEISGNFERGDMVVCIDQNGQEVARGLINYSIEEALQIKQKPSSEIMNILGFCHANELIHRDNLVLK